MWCGDYVSFCTPVSWVGFVTVCMVAARLSVCMLAARAAAWHSRTVCILSPDLPAYAVPVYSVAIGGCIGYYVPATTSNG